jgi:hypothetical protein
VNPGRIHRRCRLSLACLSVLGRIDTPLPNPHVSDADVDDARSSHQIGDEGGITEPRKAKRADQLIKRRAAVHFDRRGGGQRSWLTEDLDGALTPQMVKTNRTLPQVHAAERLVDTVRGSHGLQYHAYRAWGRSSANAITCKPLRPASLGSAEQRRFAIVAFV